MWRFTLPRGTRASASWSSACVLLCLCWLPSCLQTRVAALVPLIEPEPSYLEGAAHGFPALRTLDGRFLARGEFTQWLESDLLHVRIRYDFDARHYAEEQVVLQQTPQLQQRSWSWSEVRDGKLERRFEVDFVAGRASAEKLEHGELQRWSERVHLDPGRAFEGSAFTLVLKSLRARLLAGETIELQTVGFTPKPKVASIAVSHASLDTIRMSGLEISGDQFVIHPLIPWIAKLFVKAPDTHLWLVHTEPAAFLRWEGPFAEPSDATVRVDLLPGEPSEPATPAEP